MKTIKKFLLSIGVLTIGCVSLYADGNTNTGGWSRPIPLKPTNPINNRPKSPSMQQVYCTYSDGNLHFEFAFPEGQCRLILSDLVTGETVAAGFDSVSTEPVYVGYHSTASLTVTTANGNTYSGNW